MNTFQSTALIIENPTDTTMFLCKLLVQLKDHDINKIC